MSSTRHTYVLILATLISCVLLFSQTAHIAHRAGHAANLSPCTQQLVKLAAALPDQKMIASANAVIMGGFALIAAFLLGVYGFELRELPLISAVALRQFAGIQRKAFAIPCQRTLFVLRV